MLKIEDLVSSLLLRHSCVIIHNFGGFVAKTISAKLDRDRGLFLAPSKQLLFNKNLLNNDGLLISEYASLNAIEYSKSQSEIEEFVLDLKSKLNSKQSVHIERVGKLSYDLEGNLVFEQDRYFNLLLSSYGLSQVQFIANKEPEINEPSIIDKKIKEKAPIRKINYLKYAAAACLLPLAFYSFWIPTHSGVLESGLISFKDFNPFYKKEIGAYSQQKMATQQNDVLEKNVFENQITTSKNHRIGLYKFDEGINIPIRIEEKKIVKEILDIKIKTNQNIISSTNTFEYIIGCFSNKNNALALISKLKKEGFNAKIAGGSPLVRVSIGGADSDLQMQTIIQKANEKGYKGWILKK
ncbi:MAG: SPOR domain-containing protein [Flavobacteriia bacterium]|nr:SPOR domain-containing protein [Flavobacteriia bacterium]